MSSLLTFRSRGALYAVESEAVTEVVGLPALSAWPAAPPGVVGVIDYRGEVIPVLDISARLGGGAQAWETSETDQLIVVDLVKGRAALLVEEALTLLTGQEIRPLPAPLPSSLVLVAPFLKGLAGFEERVVLVLELARVTDFQESPTALRRAPLGSFSDKLLQRAQELARPIPPPPDRELRDLVVVRLGGEYIGLPVAEVAELAERPSYTAVPGAPRHLLGLAYHRGGLLRLVDIRLSCGLETSGPMPGQMVVLAGEGTPTGLVVDSIEAVVALEGKGSKLAFKEGWLTVLDIERLKVREPSIGASL